MRIEEEEHGENAKNAGAESLPEFVRKYNENHFKNYDKNGLLSLKLLKLLKSN